LNCACASPRSASACQGETAATEARGGDDRLTSAGLPGHQGFGIGASPG
jgi:hypothetical protein